MSNFKRENRYFVIKRKHLDAAQDSALRNFLADECISSVVECVVVEANWPEYSTVWQMVEDRVTTGCALSPPDKIEISRELAEGIANYMEGSASGMVQFWHDQLRALLAKSDDAEKVNNRQMGLMQFVEKHAAPVAKRQCSEVGTQCSEHLRTQTTQHQGEPVAADYPECSGIPESCPENEGFGCCTTETGQTCPGDGVNACKRCQKSFTSPPAPVAVVLPDRSKQRGGHFYIGWNACLDMVKELNK